MNREKLYDLIYAKADKLFKQYNPCNIRIENNVLLCNTYDDIDNPKPQLCCGGCEYIRLFGCTVKCLACKIGFCYEDICFPMHHQLFLYKKKSLHTCNKCNGFYKKLCKLKKIADRYDLLEIRTAKKYVF